MISTECNILDIIQLSEQDIDFISIGAKEDCESKLRDINEDFDLTDYEFSIELIAKITLIKDKRI